jgi:hypothetical protein
MKRKAINVFTPPHALYSTGDTLAASEGRFHATLPCTPETKCSRRPAGYLGQLLPAINCDISPRSRLHVRFASILAFETFGSLRLK